LQFLRFKVGIILIIYFHSLIAFDIPIISHVALRFIVTSYA